MVKDSSLEDEVYEEAVEQAVGEKEEKDVAPAEAHDNLHIITRTCAYNNVH